MEVLSVCIIGGTAFLRSMLQETVWFYDPCALRLSDTVPRSWHYGEDISSRSECHDVPELSLHGPRRVLEYDPIPIEVLERLPLGFPIGIIRGDTSKSRCKHPGTTGFPLVLIGKI
jgi:hypothetical protein